jgi:hypothetical protein
VLALQCQHFNGNHTLDKHIAAHSLIRLALVLTCGLS